LFGKGLVALLVLAAPLSAQRVAEWQIGALATLSDASLIAGGVGYARRAGRARLAVNVSAGSLDGVFAGRGEVLAGFLLTPARRRGAGIYAAGGVAVITTRTTTAERLVATLGVEGTPGGRSGWYVEAGVGGGVRVAAGFRWRQFSR